VENYSGEFYISSGVLPSGVHLTLLAANPGRLRESREERRLAPHEGPAERLEILGEVPLAPVPPSPLGHHSLNELAPLLHPTVEDHVRGLATEYMLEVRVSCRFGSRHDEE